MTLFDMNYFLKQIQVLYSREMNGFTLDELEEWYDNFHEIDKKVFKKALYDWVKYQHRPPLINHMIGCCNQIIIQKRWI